MTFDFEVLRFSGAPAGGGVAVLELEGRFGEGRPRGREHARLLVENADGGLEIPPLAVTDLPNERWRATYGLALERLHGATYALAIGRDLLLDLPAPDVEGAGPGSSEHLVRLAREANDLRRRLDEAERIRRAAEEQASEAAAALAAERDGRVVAERERDELQAGRERDSGELAQLRETLETVQREADERAAAAQSEAAAALQAAAEEAERRLAEERAEAERRQEEAVAAERARHQVAVHELRSARAEAENLRRELEGRRAAAASARARASRPAEETEETAVLPRAEQPETEPGGDEDTGGGPVPRAEWGGGDDPSPASEADPTEPVRARRTATVPDRGEPSSNGEDTAGAWHEPGGEEGFRVLSARPPRRRHRPEDEEEPETLPPGAAAIGARLLEPAHGTASQTTRLMAVVALGVAVLAALIVILGAAFF